MGKKLKIESSKKREKLKLFSTTEFSSALEGSRIEMFSNNEAIIEGCLGVYEYNENYLKLRISSGVLVIVGEEFNIVSFGDKTTINDMNGNKIAYIEQELFHFTPNYNIYINDKNVCKITKKFC